MTIRFSVQQRIADSGLDDRNATAHSNGHIFYRESSALDRKITEILRVVDEIQTHSKPVIEHAYREFLLQNHDPEDREYDDGADQIREVLIHGNYLSPKDIEICAAFDISEYEKHPNFAGIKALHQTLRATYAESEAAPTS